MFFNFHQGFTSTPLGGTNSDQLSPLDHTSSCGLSIRTNQFSEFPDNLSTTNSHHPHTLPDENNNQSSSSVSENMAPNSSDSSSLDVKSIQEGVYDEEELPVPALLSSWAPPPSPSAIASLKRPFPSNLTRYVASPSGVVRASSPSRSLRSSLLGSKTRQASKIARASLYQNVAENHQHHPYKRRRVLHFRQRRQSNVVTAARRKAVLPPKQVENFTVSTELVPPTTSLLPEVTEQPSESKNTTAMTDSCGASTLEMST